MNHWLMKSEPEVFSISDLRRLGTAGWDGVRNYQARNFLRAMRKGDLALFYHSNARPPAVVGIMEVAREAYPDPASPEAASPWSQVDVRFLRAFPEPLSLDRIRSIPALKDMVLLKQGRLSVQPVTAREWNAILKAAG
ncbi:MAG: EVE domain-containing protein [Elusimicrobiota bacterium]